MPDPRVTIKLIYSTLAASNYSGLVMNAEMISPLSDNLTSISDRGKPVVDYIINPQYCLDKCVSIKVNTMIHSIVHVNFKVRTPSLKQTIQI